MASRIVCDQCGYTHTSKTPALAAYALRQHSCERHREREARGRRRLEQLASSGPEAPCVHDGRHPHGDRVRYVIDRCRCRPCRDAARDYQNQRTRDRAYGRVAYVDASPARAHVRRLQHQGMGLKRIVATGAISQGGITKLMYGDHARGMGPSKRIRPATAEAILAVRLDLASGAVVDGTGTRRRVQALACLGWSLAEQARRLGYDPTNVARLVRGDMGTTAGTAAKVRALYDELWSRPAPPSGYRGMVPARTRRWAARQGWVSPLAWDDDSIDDPAARPAAVTTEAVEFLDEVAIERAIAQGDVDLDVPERVEATRRLAGRGWPDSDIARQLRVTARTVLRDRRDNNIDSRWAA